MAAKLEVRNVRKSFRHNGSSLTVLDDLSLTVEDLEFIVLLGPSGCGKSTLLRIIDGIETCDTGSVVLNGRDVTGRTGEGRGMVFQASELFPWRTVLQNVEFGLEIAGVERKERRETAQHYVSLVGLSQFENSYPHQLSGGMQQRVGIARALAIKPQLLLMDEPYGALDVMTRDLMQVELLRIWEIERKTVLFVTHSIEEAIFLADRIVSMTPRPGAIDRIITVPFGRPRKEELKASPEFQALRRDIWNSLKVTAHV
jgi:NitT/TauT family transport system ATP-binding protein